MANRALEEYLALPYTIEVIHDMADGYDAWFARVRELPGCMTEADSFEELGPMIRDAMTGWIETAIEDGQPVPEPRPMDDYSGKFIVRVPRSLHRELAEGAEREGVSQNAFLNVVLTRGLLQRSPETVTAAEPRPAPAPAWEGLSGAAWAAMSRAGLRVEAQAVDEQLFANWLGNQLAQVQGALQGGYTRDAGSQVELMRSTVASLAGTSPLMAVFGRVLDALGEQIVENARYREGLVQQTLTHAEVQRQVQNLLSSVAPAPSGPEGLFAALQSVQTTRFGR